ncbi:MAG: histidine phosphatase family protein [Clostridia bacterium]|nr:histidine phosphatase family protein [Clostridia bacterium]
MKLYLIRHGESYSNTGGTVMSYTDMPLTEKGKEQACRAGRALRDALRTEAPLYAFCSDLSRTQQTAAAFLEQIDRRPEPVITADLTEMNLGDMEGMTWPKRMETFPDIKTDTGLSEAVVPGGESFQDVKKRCLRFARERLAVLEEDAVVLVFSHGLTLRVLVNTLLGRPDKDVNRLNWMENTAITEIQYCAETGCGECLRLNDYDHLGELGAGDYAEWGIFCTEPY